MLENGDAGDSKPFIPNVLLPADTSSTTDSGPQASYGATENMAADGSGGGLVNMAADVHSEGGVNGATAP